MAMVKPIAQSKNAFDATKAEYFSYTSVGGNQVVKNKITVRDNVTNTVVYTNTLETFANGQDVPANKLQNGKYYNFFFNTFDINGTMSPDSNIISFYCYTKPTIIFKNITNGATVESSNFNFIFEYNQIEGELLDNLKITLYDINGTALDDSGTIYAESAPPNQFEHIFNGMSNNTSYRVKIEGVTVNGTRIESSNITFEVRFENPAVYSKIDLENKCDDGYIQFRSNLVFVDAESNPDPPVYIDGTAVDVTQIGDWVKWIEGFEIPSGFILRLWMNPALLGEFCKLWNNSELDNYIRLDLLRDYFVGDIYAKDLFMVYAKQGDKYVRKYSNTVDALNNLSDIIVWVKKDGTTWELILDVVNRTPSVCSWNSEYESESNIEYNKITDMYWNDDTATLIRYSDNSNGENMYEYPAPYTKYVGVSKIPISELVPPVGFDGYVMNDNDNLADKFWIDYSSDTGGDMEFYTGGGFSTEYWYSQIDPGTYVFDKARYKLSPQMVEDFKLARLGTLTMSLDIKCSKYGANMFFEGNISGRTAAGIYEVLIDFGKAPIPNAGLNHISLNGTMGNPDVDMNKYTDLWIVFPNGNTWAKTVGAVNEIHNLNVYGKYIPVSNYEKWANDKTKYVWSPVPGEFAKDT